MAGKNFKNVDKYWGIWYSVLYGMLEIRWINFNMGCFEILTAFCPKLNTAINFNMGCFEIKDVKSRILVADGLTLTWDVLKCACSTVGSTSVCRLTLTWDVLKCCEWVKEGLDRID